MKIMGSRVLLKPEIEQEKLSPGGLIIPNPQSDNITGEVLEVGPEVKLVNKGDRVVISKHDGSKIENNILVQEAGILIVL